MFNSKRTTRIIGLILLSGVLIVSVTGCRGLFGRNSGPIDAFAFLPQSNEQLSQPVQGAINNRPDPKEIVLVVPPGTDMSRLVASITLNTEAAITVISTGRRVPQTSLTPNNFSSPVTYGIEIPGEDEPILYTVRVREASTNARLIELSIAGSTYQRPTFGPNVDAYQAEVPFATQSIQVTARAEDPKAFAISINGARAGAGQGSAAVDFSYQDTTDITVEVVAEDQNTRQEYRITVVRGEPDRNSNLSGLSIEGSPFDQVFRVDRKSYDAGIAYSAQEITIVVRPESEFSTVSVNDVQTNEAGAATIPLDDVQKQMVDVVVTAEDGSTSIYTVSLTRAAPDSNVSLARITTSVGELSPPFSPDETFYSLSLPDNQASVTIGAQAVSALTLVGVTTDSGPARPAAEGRGGQTVVNVAEGEQALIIITTTAESGSTRDYRVAVRREIGMNMVVLSDLTMSGATLTPAFDPQVTSYTASVAADVDMVQVVATPLDPSIELSVGDRFYPELPAAIDILLYEGVTVKTVITLTGPNDLERVYTIGVERPKAPTPIGRRILQVTMDNLRLSRQIASSLNSNRSNLDAEARIEVRYHDDGEILYEDSAPVTTEKARQDVLVSMSYRSQFIDVDLGQYLDIEISIPTTAGRYLHYNTVVFANDSLDIRPDFMALSESPRMDWPQAGTPRPVTARVLYQASDAARNRMSALGDSFILDSQGEFEITLELIDLATGRSLGSEILPAKPGSVHGRGIEFANGIDLPEGARVGYILTAQTRAGRLLRAHGSTEVRTLETFDNGEWEFASLFVEAALELVETGGR
jgi:cadherin-like protein